MHNAMGLYAVDMQQKMRYNTRCEGWSRRPLLLVSVLVVYANNSFDSRAITGKGPCAGLSFPPPMSICVDRSSISCLPDPGTLANPINWLFPIPNPL